MRIQLVSMPITAIIPSQGGHHKTFKKLENYNGLQCYPVIYSICHNELIDVTSCGKSASESKWYNNELCKNLKDQLVF